MKSKNFILRVLVTAIIGLLVWWFLRPTPKVPEKTAAAPIAAKTDAPKPPSPLSFAPTVELPALKPVAAHVTATPPDPNDPQTNLKTAIQDIARLARTGDMATLQQTYTMPEKFDPQQIEDIKVQEQQAVNDPQMQQARKALYDKYVQSFDELENQTPVYNAAGDEAIYARTITLNGGSIHQSFTFIKINGKWYVKEISESSAEVDESN